MLSMQQVNTLSHFLENSFGKSSQQIASVKGHLHHDKLTVRYTSVVHFAAEQSLQLQMPALEHESNSLINEGIKKLKSDYRSEIGSSLPLTELSNNDSLEIIQATAQSPRRVAYYRRIVTFQIG